MSKKSKRKQKHIPQRTCVGCRSVQSKRSLIRLVRTPEGIQIDPSGKMAGRGAYLHELQSCWEKGLQGSLGHALKTSLTPEDKARLEQYMVSLPTASSAGDDEMN